MSDPIKTLTALIEKQKQAVDAQRAEAERIQKEREQATSNGTAPPAPMVTQPPNK